MLFPWPKTLQKYDEQIRPQRHSPIIAPEDALGTPIGPPELASASRSRVENIQSGTSTLPSQKKQRVSNIEDKRKFHSQPGTLGKFIFCKKQPAIPLSHRRFFKRTDKFYLSQFEFSIHFYSYREKCKSEKHYSSLRVKSTKESFSIFSCACSHCNCLSFISYIFVISFFWALILRIYVYFKCGLSYWVSKELLWNFSQMCYESQLASEINSEWSRYSW